MHRNVAKGAGTIVTGWFAIYVQSQPTWVRDNPRLYLTLFWSAVLASLYLFLSFILRWHLVQRFFGIRQTASRAEQVTRSSRLRIIEARYGVEGGNDRDVLDEFLSPRLKGDALVGWVGSDLFGPLDPAIGQPKRLRVKYSFDGVERLIVRKENEMLVLPEDVAALKRLERELEAIHNDAVNRLAKGYERDLETAQRSSQQCERERRELIEIFPILEVQALKLAREMHLFLRNEFEKPMEVTPEMPQNRRLDVMVANYDWRVRLADAFEHRFAAKVKQLYSQFGEIGIRPQKVPESFSEHISTLISLAHEHGRECLLKSES